MPPDLKIGSIKWLLSNVHFSVSLLICACVLAKNLDSDYEKSTSIAHGLEVCNP